VHVSLNALLLVIYRCVNDVNNVDTINDSILKTTIKSVEKVRPTDKFNKEKFSVYIWIKVGELVNY
jgi:hypothetical protein